MNTSHSVLKSAQLNTPLGSMIAIANEEALFFLAFGSHIPPSILPGKTPVILSIEKELEAYFKGTLDTFHTPLLPQGTPFQKRAWETLSHIPYGETRSYVEQATLIGNTLAYRAVANANSANQLAIVIPCHRIIKHNGTLGGYRGGIMRKRWLIHHEQRFLYKMLK